MGLFSLEKIFGATIRESATDGSDFTNPDADYRRLFLGEDGLLHLKDSAGAVTDIGASSSIPGTIFDAKGDLIAATAADTAARLAVGANDAILMADSGQSTGLKWVASQTPSTQAFGDAAAEGTADTYARGDHKHAMPASPSGTLIGLTAYRNASDASLGATSSTTSVDVDATNLSVAFTAPASTNVLVRFTCYGVNDTAAKSDYWQVRESTTVLAEELITTNELGGKRMTAVMRIAGISAGAHTYKWGYKTSGGIYTLYGGPAFGTAAMEIWAAP